MIFLIVGLVAYAIGLIAWIPARALISERANLRVGGTIWRGEAVLASTIRIDWSFAPLTTLANLAFSADWRMTGGGTDLAGSATQGGDVVKLERISGQADGTLLDALAPRLPIQCRFLADLAIQKLVFGGVAQQLRGTARTSPASCSARAFDAPAINLPALRAEMAPSGPAGSIGALMTSIRREHLVEFRLSRGGAVSIWPTASAVRLAPALAAMRYD
ncbi:MAG: hypothetical protein ABIT04_07085, partial [Novosphingobium sp.]